MARERIAEGYIDIALNDRDALSGIRNVEREFHRAMSDMDRESATANIDAEIGDLQKKVKTAKAELDKLEKDDVTVELRAEHKQLTSAVADAKRRVRELDGMQADPELSIDDKEFQKKRAEAVAEVKRLDGMRAEIELAVDVEGMEKARRNYAELETMEGRLQKIRSKLITETRKEMRAAEMEQQRAQRQGMALARAEAQAYKMENDRTLKGMTEREEKLVEILKLQKEYARLTDERERIAKRNPVGREAHAKVELDAAGVEAKMMLLKKRLQILGAKPPVDIKVDIQRRGLQRVTGLFMDLGSKIAKGAAGLQDMTLRIGPFTASLRQFGVALAFLGPIILDLVGATGALVSVLGSGLMGAAAAAGAAFTGLGLGIAGVALAVKPVVGDIKLAQQAMTAYHKAVVQYGKGSDQAKTAQEKLNKTLKNIDPNAAEAARGITKLQTSWEKLSKPTQSNVAKIFADGLNTANAMLPRFAARTNEFSGMLRDGFKSAFDYLRHDGGDAIDTIQANFNRSFPAMLRGMGGFGKGLINIFREVSKYLPQMMSGFERIGQRLSSWTESGGKFTSTVREWVESARDLARFFGAAGRVLMHFFGAGQDAGQGFLRTMTKALDRWDKFLTSADGHKSTAAFFDRAVKGTQELYNALSPLIAAFVQWADNLSPVVTGFMKGVAAVSKLIAKVTELTGMGGVLSTFGATLGALWAVSKIGSFISRLSGVALGFNKIAGAAKAALVAEEAAMVAGGPGGIIGTGGRAARYTSTAARGAGAAETAGMTAMATRASGLTRVLTGLRGAATAVVPAIGEMGAVAGGLATAGVVGLGVALAGAAGYGLYKLFSNSKSAAEKFAEALDQSAQAAKRFKAASDGAVGNAFALGQAMKGNREATKGAARAAEDYYKARAKFGANDPRTIAALDAYNSKLQERQTTEQQLAKTRQVQQRLDKVAEQSLQQRGKAQDLLTDAIKRQKEAQQRVNALSKSDNPFAQRALVLEKRRLAEATKEVADAQKTVRDWTDKVNAAQAAAILKTTNLKRAMAGFGTAVQGMAKKALVDLSKLTGGKGLAVKIGATFVDSKDVRRVANQASAALKAGASSKLVMKIVADAKDAQQAILRLKAAKIDPKHFKVVAEGGDKAESVLRKLAGRKLSDKEIKIAQRGGDAALALLTKIQRQNLKEKWLHIFQKGGEGVQGILAAIKGVDLGSATKLLKAHDQASPVINMLKGITSLGTAFKNIVTHVSEVFTGRRATGGPISGYAQGGSPNMENAYRAAATRPARRSTMGARIDKPTYITGEEGAAHPEFVIATNPAYRRSNLAYWAQAGHDLGVPGFARGGSPTGGKLTLQQLADLWVAAGGPRKMAGMMARVAYAESQGNIGAHNASGATGLWQILGQVVPGNLYDPIVNAKNAIKKWRDAGGLGPWTASRNAGAGGGWGQFLGRPGVVPTKNLSAWAHLKGVGGMIPGGSMAVKFAQGMIGHFKETMGNNKGPELNKLEREFGLTGQAWCAMFVSKALEKAGIKAKTASVAQLVTWAKAGSHGLGGLRRSGKSAKPGDVWVDSSQQGHTGIVERVGKDGRVYVIAGNTSKGQVSRASYAAGSGYVISPKYGMVAGKGNYQKVQLVPGRFGLSLGEQSTKLQSEMTGLGADVNEDILMSNAYVGRQISLYQVQEKQIASTRKALRRVNKRIHGVQTVDQRKKDVQRRSELTQSLGTLKDSQRGLVHSVNLTIATRGAKKKMNAVDFAQAKHDALTPDDSAGNVRLAKRRVKIAQAAWDAAKGNKHLTRQDKIDILGTLASAKQTLSTAQEGAQQAAMDAAQKKTDAAQLPENLAQLYMAGQTTNILNPMNNAFTSAQLLTPNDLRDDMSALQPILAYWQKEFPEALASGVQSRIDWAAQGLQAAQSSMEQITQGLTDQSRAPLDTALSVAGLTPYNLNDDLAATQNLVSWWTGEYQAALASGVQSRVQNAAQMLAQYQAQAIQLTKQLQEQPLQAQYALAQLTDSMKDDTDALTSLLNLHEQWLAQAQAVGDYAGIIEEAGQVKQLRDQLKNIQDTQAQQIGDFNAARLNLYRTMGSNNALPGAAQKVINVTNNYKTMPEDPHSWSKSVAFELQTAL